MQRLILCLALVAGCSSSVAGRTDDDDVNDASDHDQGGDNAPGDADPADGDNGQGDAAPILTDLSIETPGSLTIGEPLVVTAHLTAARADATTVTWHVTRGEQLEYAAVSSADFGGELPTGDATLTIPAGELEATTTLATGTAGLADALALSLSFSADGGTVVRQLAINPRATDIKDIGATAYHGRLLRHDGVVLTAQGCPSADGVALTHADLPAIERIATGGLAFLYAQSVDDELLAIDTHTLQIGDDGLVEDVTRVADPAAAQIVDLHQSYYFVYITYADGTLQRVSFGGNKELIASTPRRIGLPMFEAFLLSADSAGVVTLIPNQIFPYDEATIPTPYATWPDLRAMDGLHAAIVAIRGNGDLIAVESLPDDDAGPFPNTTVARSGFIPDAANVAEVKMAPFSRTFVRWANGDVRFIDAAAMATFPSATLSPGEPLRFSHPPLRTVGCFGGFYCALVVGNTIECL